MAIQELRGKIFRKAGNGKGFLIEGQENWFNAGEKVVSYLAKLNIGDEIEISYFKKGVKQEVTMIKKIEIKKEEPKEEESEEFVCEDCGATLKNNKYKKCYTCNQKVPKSKVYDKPEEAKKEWKPKSDYNNPERDRQIRKGNSLNASAAVLSGADCIKNADPETIAEITKVVANILLEYLEAD